MRGKITASLPVVVVSVALLLFAGAVEAARVNISIRSGSHQVEFGEVWLTRDGKEIPGSRVDFGAFGQFGPGQTRTLTTANIKLSDVNDIHLSPYTVDGDILDEVHIGPPVSQGVWYPLPPDALCYMADDTLAMMFEDATGVETGSWGEIKALYP